MYEAEIKYFAPDGFVPPGKPQAEVVYHDVYFDSGDGAFHASGRELRLRACGGTFTLTCKSPPFDAATASKEEWETTVADPAAMEGILTGLGFTRRIAFAKRCRRSRVTAGGIALEIAVVTVDFSADTFVEIEHLAKTRQDALAALAVIRDHAASLGLARECRRYYTDLYLDALGGRQP